MLMGITEFGIRIHIGLKKVPRVTVHCRREKQIRKNKVASLGSDEVFLVDWSILLYHVPLYGSWTFPATADIAPASCSALAGPSALGRLSRCGSAQNVREANRTGVGGSTNSTKHKSCASIIRIYPYSYGRRSYLRFYTTKPFLYSNTYSSAYRATALSYYQARNYTLLLPATYHTTPSNSMS